MIRTFKFFAVLLSAISFCRPFSSTAQPDWQWGKRGGTYVGSGGGDEHVISMETDLNGNVYVLSRNAMGAYPQMASLESEFMIRLLLQAGIAMEAFDG